MSGPTTHRVVHTRTVDAPPEALYALVADVRHWPVIFGPTVHVDLLDHDDAAERFQIWALVNDSVKTWTSRRTFDAGARHITFRQEASAAPIASMGGDWTFAARPGGGTEIVLGHDFTVADDDAAALDWVRTALDRNSEAELAALARVAELGHPVGDLVLAFADDVPVSGSAADAQAFVDRADRWPERLPHVSRVELTEDEPGVQRLEMDTVTPDGSTHTTSSVRLCVPGRIVYKQLVPPALLLGHSGAWFFTDSPGGDALVGAHHLVALNPAAIPDVLGAGTTLEAARDHVRSALGANSRATMARAGAHAARTAP
jgi:aromatase